MPKSRSIHEELYLGVDGGASNITVAIVNKSGQVAYQQTTAASANLHAVGLDQAIDSIESAIQQAIEDISVPAPVVFEHSYFGLSGCNFPSDRKQLESAIRYSPLNTMLGKGFTVVNDNRIALRSGLEDSVGIALIAGTGSNCLGRASDGREVQSGGWDYILADEGAGYDIGLRTLKTVTRTLDGRAESTRLSKEIMTHLQVTNLEQLHEVVYRKYQTKSAIASLSQIVSEVAETGDHQAQAILNHSANELIKMVDAVMTALEWRDTPISVVLVGSAIQRGSYLRRRFEAEVRRVNPMVRTIDPQISPALAAALLALEEAKSTAKSKASSSKSPKDTSTDQA